MYSHTEARIPGGFIIGRCSLNVDVARTRRRTSHSSTVCAASVKSRAMLSAMADASSLCSLETSSVSSRIVSERPARPLTTSPSVVTMKPPLLSRRRSMLPFLPIAVRGGEVAPKGIEDKDVEVWSSEVLTCRSEDEPMYRGGEEGLDEVLGIGSVELGDSCEHGCTGEGTISGEE